MRCNTFRLFAALLAVESVYNREYLLCVMALSNNESQEFSVDEALRIAGECFEEGRYHACSNFYSAILKANPNIPIANQRMASINEVFGNHEEALSFYKYAIKNPPFDIAFLAGYIRLLIKMGKIMEARKTLERTKDIFIKASADDQYTTLVKQLAPKRKLEFFYSYLGSIGIFDYEEGDLMASNSKISPLLTNSFLHWFETQNWADKTFLELGSGSSTLYFARHFQKVISWETEESWFVELTKKIPANVELKKVDTIIDSFRSFDINSCDVILIDCGENRANVAKAISESDYEGIVFFDNAEWYRKGVQALTKSGFREMPFFGIKPVQNRVSCTSVLFRDLNTSDIFSSNWKALPEFANYFPDNAWDIIETP